MDGPEAGTVTGGHVLVHGLDSVGAGHVTVFLVHVVGTGAGVVTDPDTEVLDLLGALLVNLQGDLLTCILFQEKHSAAAHCRLRTLCSSCCEQIGKYLVEGDDLAVCLLDLPQLGEEVPETRLGHNIVGGKDAHAVKLRGGVGLTGEETANDLVLLKATYVFPIMLACAHALCRDCADRVMIA